MYTIKFDPEAIDFLAGLDQDMKNIFDSDELGETSVSSILEHAARDGKNYITKFYNLDAIIAVGYRVNSYRATQFRIWATKTLREFIIKGFVLDDERLKQGNNAFGIRYSARSWPIFLSIANI
jgi:hypothetical protein